MLKLLDKSVLQLSVTALFYLEDSRKIHLKGVRARRSKDVKRRAPPCGGGPLAPVFICVFLPPGPAPCKLGFVWSAVQSEVLSLVLDLPLTFLCCIFARFSLPCLLATAILDSFSLF